MLSERQVQAFRESTARINIWTGAVRSGKTVSSLLRWLEYVATAPRGGELMMVGKSTATVFRNLFTTLTDPAVVGARVPRDIHYTPGAVEATIFGRRVHVIGANDVRAENRIRGITGAGAYVDEATVVPEEFWDQLVARQSVPGASIFATTNPDSPSHWLRTKWLAPGNPSVRSWHFTLDDNPYLDADYVAHLKRSYTGLWYRRFILGEWCAAEGAIYDQFDTRVHVVDDMPHIRSWIACGIDYGTTNPFHAVLIGLGIDGCMYVTSEFRYDSRRQHRQLTDVEYSARFRQWLASAPIPTTNLVGVTPRHVVVDPSAASFRVQLHRDGVSSWEADNSVLDGIRVVSSLLSAQPRPRLYIHRSCRHLIDEMTGYAWDPKAQEKGEDKPLKQNDHGVDALRYAIKTTQAVWQGALGHVAA